MPAPRGRANVAHMIRLAAPIVVAGALALPATAAAATYDVPEVLGPRLDRVVERSSVDVLVPDTIRLDFDGAVHAFGGATRDGYTLSLAGDPECGGANACFLASFGAERGGRPFGHRTVRLARGIRGRYKRLTCGASCSPPWVSWKQRGVVYTITAKVGADSDAARRRALVRAANSAIRRGPR